MVKIPKTLLWRVTWIHRNGYSSPIYWVETNNQRDNSRNRKAAVKEAKLKSRLADFPKTWYCRVTDVTDYEII